jgi:hypothetical protein
MGKATSKNRKRHKIINETTRKKMKVELRGGLTHRGQKQQSRKRRRWGYFPGWHIATIWGRKNASVPTSGRSGRAPQHVALSSHRGRSPTFEGSVTIVEGDDGIDEGIEGRFGVGEGVGVMEREGEIVKVGIFGLTDAFKEGDGEGNSISAFLAGGEVKLVDIFSKRRHENDSPP